MLVSEIIKRLAEFPQNAQVRIVGIVDVDDLPEAEDWSEYEDLREIEDDPFDVYLENGKVIIQF